MAQLDSGKYAGKKVSRAELEADSESEEYDEESENEDEEMEILSKMNQKRSNPTQEEEEEDLTGLIAVEAGSDEELDDGKHFLLHLKPFNHPFIDRFSSLQKTQKRQVPLI